MRKLLALLLLSCSIALSSSALPPVHSRKVEMPWPRSRPRAMLCAARAPKPLQSANRSRYDEGDHVIFVGEVERCSWRPGASPLLFHGGHFYTEHPF